MTTLAPVDGWTHVEHVMGMAVSIDVRAASPEDDAPRAAVEDTVAFLHWVDAVFTTYDDASEIRRLGRGAPVLPCTEVREVLALGERLRSETLGYFDVWASGELDPSGVVKGWAVEEVSRRLHAAGLGVHCVNAGGDIRCRGREWRIGIAHPHVRSGLAGVITIDGGAVATSGTAERGAHVIDPHTGRAALDLASVSVVGTDLAVADAYATAALAMGELAPDWLAGLAGHEALVVYADGRSWRTPGWPGVVPSPVR